MMLYTSSFYSATQICAYSTVQHRLNTNPCLLSPFTLGKWSLFHARRVYKYRIMKEEADEEEKEYCTRLAVGLTENQWEVIS